MNVTLCCIPTANYKTTGDGHCTVLYLIVFNDSLTQPRVGADEYNYKCVHNNIYHWRTDVCQINFTVIVFYNK